MKKFFLFAAVTLLSLTASAQTTESQPRETTTTQAAAGALKFGYFSYEEAMKSSADYRDRKSTRLNSSHANISYAVFCLKKKKEKSPRRAPPSGGDPTRAPHASAPTAPSSVFQSSAALDPTSPPLSRTSGNTSSSTRVDS